MIPAKLVVDSDVILQHLRGGNAPSVFRRAMNEAFCYTTVFHAIDLFARVSGSRGKRAVTAALSAVKILGLNARGAPRYGELLRARPGVPLLLLLGVGLCAESGLPLLTARPALYRGIKGIRLLPPSALRVTNDH